MILAHTQAAGQQHTLVVTAARWTAILVRGGLNYGLLYLHMIHVSLFEVSSERFTGSQVKPDGRIQVDQLLGPSALPASKYQPWP